MRISGILRSIKAVIIGAVLCAAFAAAPAGLAGAAETSGSATVDVLTDYVWRGQRLSDGDGVIQPSVGVTYGNFGANLWANYDVDTNEQNETDLTLSYGVSRGKLSLEAGYIYYALDGVNDTQEVYLSLGVDVLLAPSVTLYYDFDEGDGAFLVAAVSHSFPFGGGVSLNFGASVSVNMDNEIMGLDSSGEAFTDLYNSEVGASVSIPVTEHVSIEPRIAYSSPIGSDAEDVLEAIDPDGDGDVFYGGVGVYLSF
jgi:hypothetical protein